MKTIISRENKPSRFKEIHRRITATPTNVGDEKRDSTGKQRTDPATKKSHDNWGGGRLHLSLFHRSIPLYCTKTRLPCLRYELQSMVVTRSSVL